ncbi:MAG: DUF3833 family protein [Granulosicoccus sp.]
MAVSLREYSDRKLVDSGSGNTAEFSFTDYFHGHTKASGWFADRFGKPRRHFCGDFYGSFDASGMFILDEKLYYTDGVFEEREWTVSISEAGVFKADSDSLIGQAHGLMSGDRLTMDYSMRVKIEDEKFWDLDMKDAMILQPDGSLHNITRVHKWGLRIGVVSAQYQQHDGSQLCSDILAGR